MTVRQMLENIRLRVLILQGSSTVPTICGYNTGQHMYIDASDDCNIINLDIDTGSNQDRSWSFRVKQSHKLDETISSFWIDSTLGPYFRGGGESQILWEIHLFL